MNVSGINNYDKLQTLIAGTDLVGLENTFVKFGSGGLVNTGDGELADGVVVNANLQDNPCGVMTEVGQIILLRSGEAIVKGADIASDAAGKAKASTTGDIILARALQAAAASDQYIMAIFLGHAGVTV